MGLFKGKDDNRHDAHHAAANRAKAKGDDEKEQRQRAKAKDLAKNGDVSTYSKSGLGWDKNGKLV